MAVVGNFGSVVFSVSDNLVKTFDGMSWDTSANYATHDRHIRQDLLEFLGPEPDSISFSMTFSVFTGTNPYSEIKKLRQIVKEGKVARLVLGGKVYGDYKWVLQKMSTDLQKFDNKGNLWAAQVKVTLKEYPKR